MAAGFHDIHCNYINMVGTVKTLLHIWYDKYYVFPFNIINILQMFTFLVPGNSEAQTKSI